MIISCTNKASLTYYFPICIAFISFSCLITLAGTASAMVNKSVRDEILAWFLILVGGSVQPLTVKYNVTCGFFLGAFYQAMEVARLWKLP